MRKLYIFLYIFLVKIVIAQEFQSRKCSNYPTPYNFNISRFTGRWYEQQGNGSPTSICRTFDFTTNEGQTKLTISLTGKNRDSGVISYSNKIVDIPDLQPGKFVANTRRARQREYDDWILDTDYEDYAISLGCMKGRYKFSWVRLAILTRARTPSQATIDRAVQYLRDNYLLYYYSVHDVEQSNCSE